MIDYRQYPLDEYDIEFLEDIRSALGEDSQNEVFLKCGVFPILLEPHGKEVCVKSKGETLAFFNSVDDMFLNFKIDEKPFIERVGEIEYA